MKPTTDQQIDNMDEYLELRRKASSKGIILEAGVTRYILHISKSKFHHKIKLANNLHEVRDIIDNHSITPTNTTKTTTVN